MDPDSGKNLFRYAPIVLGLAVIWVAYQAFFGPQSGSINGLTPPSLQGTGMKEPADFNWKLTDLDDKPVDFAEFKGRPILLNLWATWCPPCRAEMPALAALADNPRIKGKGIAVICVSTDESSATLRQFMDKKPWAMTMLRATALPAVFMTEGIPATFLIAPDGKIVVSELGAARWDDPSVVSFLENLATATE